MMHTPIQDCILGVDHIALAVPDLDAALQAYSTLGFSLVERSTVHGAHSGMLYATLKCRDSKLVLVQGNSPDSQVSRFVAHAGSGIHHIAYAVNDLDEALRRARSAGLSADTPVVSDTGIRQVFLHRDDTTGVRIELIERKTAGFSEHNVEQLFRALEAKDLF
jgi:methylmalonyl-CoA/ethylmalonyl-CoA epimerase